MHKFGENSYRLSFELPGLPRMQNNSGRSSNLWVRKKEKDSWKQAVALIVGSKRPKQPLQRASLTLTRISSVSPDPDGLVSGFKFIIDSLVDIGVLANDRYENIGMPDYRWEKCKPRQGRIRITVEELAVESAACHSSSLI